MVSRTNELISLERPSEESDEHLLLRYREKADTTAFETLVHRYEKPLFNFLFRFLRNETLAEDVFQATFLRVHQKCHQFTSDRLVRPWLFSIAAHLAIDMIRKEERSRAASLDQEYTDTNDEMEVRNLLSMLSSRRLSPLEQLEADERAQWARQAVDRLPDHLRVVLLLAYFQGLKFHEVAEILQIPLGTVKSRLHKALRLLNAAWEKDHRGEVEA